MLAGAACLITSLGFSGVAGGSTSSAYAWGDNTFGQLGNGTTMSAASPTPISTIGAVRKIDAGVTDSLVITDEGKVEDWGDNSYGNLGIGTYSGPDTCPSNSDPCSETPVKVRKLQNIKAIAAGNDFNLALLSNGTVMAWGQNTAGQLGDGTSSGPQTCSFAEACSTTPVLVSGLGHVTAIAAGYDHALALLSNGTVVAWGDDRYGQLGTTSTLSLCSDGYSCSTTPVPVSDLQNVKSIADNGGSDFSLALTGAGSVMAWGSNLHGQLGDGTNSGPQSCGAWGPCSMTPVTVNNLQDVTAIAAGANHSLALLSTQSVEAWGYNDDGQLGDGQFVDSDVPVAVNDLTGVVALSGGWEDSLALLPNGTLVYWGASVSDGSLHDAPTAIGGPTGIKKIAAGSFFDLVKT
jgi:alpha-tubulin suppressor-like RCC1 family protein